MPSRIPLHRPAGPQAKPPPRRRPEGYWASESKRFLNSEAWQRLRQLKLATDPLCEDCKEAGRLTEAKAVHHKLRRQENPDEALAIENLMSLCRTCHGIRTRRGE